MSIASISYGSLKDAAGEAKDVAKRLDRYADAIEDGVYKKLNSYSGPWSGNLSTAKSKANAKMSALRSEAKKFERYSADLIDLKEQCEATDKSVRKKVSSLTATFKEKNGIKNNPVVNAISYFFTSVGNSTSVGRWIGDFKDQARAGAANIKDAIDEWLHYEGGADLLKGVVVAALEIVIGVIAVIGAVAALIAGGAVLAILVAVATLIGGVIAIANGITNLVNEGRAYNATQKNDPATGKRLSELNTLTDTIRKESDSRLAHGIANAIDVVATVCTVVTVGASLLKNIGNLFKNGYKWATGNPVSIDSLKIRDILTKDNFITIAGKLKTSLVQGYTEISTALKYRDWSFFGHSLKNFGTDFAEVFKGKYLDFSTANKGLETVTNILKTSKDMVKEGLSLGKIALPLAPIASLPGGGYITIDDFNSIIEDSSNVFKNIASLMVSNGGPINSDIMNKLSIHSDINISVSDFQIPNISINLPEIKLA